ncbi:MAG: hypothetical protein C7B44_04710 [Sulfobacillus thermosulfidooxidans]|nr:MAG: hypothetical protein C7B44_04710 [Sulfobacillus thermosulfidooxidans]
MAHSLPEPLSQKLQDLESAFQSTYHAHMEAVAQTLVDTTQQWQADLQAMQEDLARLHALDTERDQVLADLTQRLERLQSVGLTAPPMPEPSPASPTAAPDPSVSSMSSQPAAPGFTDPPIAPHPADSPGTPPVNPSPYASPDVPSAPAAAWSSQPEPAPANVGDPVLPKLVQNF